MGGRCCPRRRAAETPQGHLGDAAGDNSAASVTDGDWAPEDVVAFYDKRDMKKAIPEFKEDFGIDRVPSSTFGATAAALELRVLAFHLLVLYQRQALAWAVLQRAKRLRRWAIAIAGQLIRTLVACLPQSQRARLSGLHPLFSPLAAMWYGR
jgi:hypothetical protein